MKKSMKACAFICDCANLLHCKCHKINLNRGRSDKDSLNLIKIKLQVMITVSDTL